MPPMPDEKKPSLLSTLWLDRGDDFIRAQHDALVEDLDRMHSAAETAGRRIIDLTREPPLTPLAADAKCHRHVRFAAVARCPECNLAFCADCAVSTSDERPPICRDCAYIAAGIRPKSRRPQA